MLQTPVHLSQLPKLLLKLWQPGSLQGTGNYKNENIPEIIYRPIKVQVLYKLYWNTSYGKKVSLAGTDCFVSAILLCWEKGVPRVNTPVQPGDHKLSTAGIKPEAAVVRGKGINFWDSSRVLSHVGLWELCCIWAFFVCFSKCILVRLHTLCSGVTIHAVHFAGCM